MGEIAVAKARFAAAEASHRLDENRLNKIVIELASEEKQAPDEDGTND
jgi:hypothetical protein